MHVMFKNAWVQTVHCTNNKFKYIVILSHLGENTTVVRLCMGSREVDDATGAIGEVCIDVFILWSPCETRLSVEYI